MTQPDRAAPSRVALWPQAAVVAAATLVPLGIWIVVVPILGADLEAASDEELDAAQTIAPVLILATAAIAALAGWALLAALKRTTPRACTIWTIVAVAVLLVSMAGPFLGAATAAATLVLALMHMGVAAVLIPGLRRTACARDRATATRPAQPATTV